MCLRRKCPRSLKNSQLGALLLKRQIQSVFDTFLSIKVLLFCIKKLISQIVCITFCFCVCRTVLVQSPTLLVGNFPISRYSHKHRGKCPLHILSAIAWFRINLIRSSFAKSLHRKHEQNCSSESEVIFLASTHFFHTAALHYQHYSHSLFSNERCSPQ